MLIMIIAFYRNDLDTGQNLAHKLIQTLRPGALLSRLNEEFSF